MSFCPLRVASELCARRLILNTFPQFSSFKNSFACKVKNNRAVVISQPVLWERWLVAASAPHLPLPTCRRGCRRERGCVGQGCECSHHIPAICRHGICRQKHHPGWRRVLFTALLGGGVEWNGMMLSSGPANAETCLELRRRGFGQAVGTVDTCVTVLQIQHVQISLKTILPSRCFPTRLLSSRQRRRSKTATWEILTFNPLILFTTQQCFLRGGTWKKEQYWQEELEPRCCCSKTKEVRSSVQDTLERCQTLSLTLKIAK